MGMSQPGRQGAVGAMGGLRWMFRAMESLVEDTAS
jgi:hypothetical protein